MKTAMIALTAILVMIFLAGVLWVSSMFFGNPASAWMARQQMEQYLAQEYPEKQFTIQEVEYDPKFGRYDGRVIEGGENDFRLYANERGVTYDQYRYSYAMDKTLTDRFNQQFESALNELLMPQFPQLHAVSPDLYVAKDTYPADTQFSSGLERQASIELFLVGDDMPVETFTRMCTDIRDALLRAGYQPSALRFLLNQPEDFQGKGGMLYYTLTIEQDAYRLPPALLQSDVKSFNLNHRGK